MENEFRFDVALVEDAIKCAKNAKSYGEGVCNQLDKIFDLTGEIQIEGLNYGDVSGIKDKFVFIETLDVTIKEVRQEAFNAMISLDSLSDTLDSWIKEGIILKNDAVDLANGYIKELSETNSNYCVDLINSTSLEWLLNQEGFSEEFIKSGQYYTEINGQEGYLYIPEGYSKGTPFVTWFAGAGSTGKNAIKKKGLPSILDSGYKMDAVVWCPVLYTSYNNETQYNTIRKLVSKYNLDEERVSLFGYSMGAEISYELARENPNYFSTVVTYGTCARYKNIVSPETTFIMFQGGRDQFGDASVTYEELVSNGNQVMLYKLLKASHAEVNTMFSDEMINDAINIRRGDKLENIVGDIVVVNGEYSREGYKITDENYYIRLSNENENVSEKVDQVKLNESEDVVLGVPVESNESLPDETVSKNEIKEENKLEETNSTVSEKTSKINVTNSNSETSSKNKNATETTNIQKPAKPASSSKPVEQDNSKQASTVLEKTSKINVINSNSETSSKNKNATETTNIQKPAKPASSSKPVEHNYSRPVTQEESIIVNILPENKFSDALPELKSGKLNFMEIGSSLVNYNISNMSEVNYNDYINSLENFGYTFVDGKWIKGNYEISINYTNNNLNIHVTMK